MRISFALIRDDTTRLPFNALNTCLRSKTGEHLINNGETSYDISEKIEIIFRGEIRPTPVCWYAW